MLLFWAASNAWGCRENLFVTDCEHNQKIHRTCWSLSFATRLLRFAMNFLFVKPNFVQRVLAKSIDVQYQKHSVDFTIPIQ